MPPRPLPTITPDPDAPTEPTIPTLPPDDDGEDVEDNWGEDYEDEGDTQPIPVYVLTALNAVKLFQSGVLAYQGRTAAVAWLTGHDAATCWLEGATPLDFERAKLEALSVALKAEADDAITAFVFAHDEDDSDPRYAGDEIPF